MNNATCSGELVVSWLGGQSGLAGVTVTLTGTTAAGTAIPSRSFVTINDGSYFFFVPAGGTYTLMATDSDGGDSFTASASQPLNNVSTNQIVNFTVTAETRGCPQFI